MAKTKVAEGSNEEALKGVMGMLGIGKAGQSVGEIVYDLASEQVSSAFSPKVEGFGYNLAKSSGVSDKRAQSYGKYAGTTFRTAVSMGMTLYKSTKDIRKTIGSYTGLSTTYAPMLKASGASNYGFLTGMRSDLEVIKNDRSTMANKAKNDAKGMMVSLLLDLPSTISNNVKHSIREMKKLDKAKRGTEGHKKYAVARGINESMNKTLDGLKKDGEYNPTVDSIVKFMNKDIVTDKGEGLASLEKLSGKIEFLENTEKTFLGNNVRLASRGLKPWLTEKFNVRSGKAFNKPTAGKMIIELEQHMKKNPSPIGLSLPGCSKKDCSLTEYITDIFVQHQNDSGRKEPDRNALGQIRQAAEQIAEAMTDPHRRLDPQALGLLVDRKHGIGTYSKGELVAVKNDEELSEHLINLQEKKGLSLRKRRQPPEKVFKEYQATKQDFADTWEQLEDEEKFLWSTFLPKEVLLEIGVSQEDERAMRHQANELWQETMEAFLGAMKQYSPTELEELGLNEVQIGTLAEAVKQSGKRSGNYLQRNRHEMTRLTADISTIIASREDKDFIKDILAEAAEKKEKRMAAIDRKKDLSLAEAVTDSRSEDNESYRG